MTHQCIAEKRGGGQLPCQFRSLADLVSGEAGLVGMAGEGARMTDANVERVRAKLLTRSQVGIAKYGVTTERKDLSRADWLRHLQEELLDAAVYIEAALADERVTAPDSHETVE